MNPSPPLPVTLMPPKGDRRNKGMMTSEIVLKEESKMHNDLS